MATRETSRKSGDGGPPGEEAPFEQLLSRLEGLVSRLEKGELPLEESLKAYEEGIGLVRRAQARLDEMDRRLEQLQSDGRTVPLEASSMKAAPGDRASPPQDGRGKGERAAEAERLYDDDLPF